MKQYETLYKEKCWDGNVIIAYSIVCDTEEAAQAIADLLKAQGYDTDVRPIFQY